MENCLSILLLCPLFALVITFDAPERESRTVKRASGGIKPYDAPAKGSRPVRERHYCDQSKILAHKRNDYDM